MKHELLVSPDCALAHMVHNEEHSERIHKLEEDEAQWKVDRERLESEKP